MTNYIAEAIEEAWGERCSEFDPECHCCRAWKQYDDLRASNKALYDGLKESRDEVEHWGSYAGEYFQEKHGLAQSLAAMDDLLARQQQAAEEAA